MIRSCTFFFALSLAACGTPAATPKAEVAAPSKAKMAETPMNDVERMLAAGDCHVYDANGPETRKEKGVLEGAVLLSSYNEYNVAVLPKSKDANLVFYCGSTQCSASDTAAERAIMEGYTKVSVMREGIAGWAKAGKKTVQPSEEG